MSVGDRIAEAREHAGFGKGDFAKRIRVSAKTLYNYESGATEPPSKTLRAIADFTGVRPDWLLSGEGRMLLDAHAPPPPASTPSTPTSVPTLSVTLYRNGHGAGAGRAGDGDAVELDLPTDYVRAQVGRLPAQGEVYMSIVRGDSMEPWLQDGQPVWIETAADIVDGGRYALHWDGAPGEVIKRIERAPGGRLRVISDNPAFSSYTLAHVEDDVYRDVDTGQSQRLVVRGRVISPRDTAQSILRTVTSQLQAVLAR